MVSNTIVPKTIALDPYIIDNLMRDLVGRERRPSAFLVYLYLWRRGRGGRKRRVDASYQTIADATGISKSAAQAAIQTLARRRLLSIERRSATAISVYSVAMPWRA
jgi:DNA-binding MarR family transcriptional regulator